MSPPYISAPIPAFWLSMFCSAPTASDRRSQAAHTTQMVKATGPSQCRKLSSQCNLASPRLNTASDFLNKLGRTTTTIPSCGPVCVVYSAIGGVKESTSTTQWFRTLHSLPAHSNSVQTRGGNGHREQ
ncbi:hypothetical protein B0H16DRAFT_1481040 [Mycena metata]|uniref:Uncharacterized protein n=1 Tax=Mycena metata TaxID=1033252 RepID=A0AAD7H0K8_9AGAR|nr:hypothetical protein B0H16DRAFT_1481040 [Mycena metata]